MSQKILICLMIFVLVSRLQLIVSLAFLRPCARAPIIEIVFFLGKNAYFQGLAKKQFEARNQIKSQNLQTCSQKSMVYELDFMVRTWFQKPFKNQALES